MDTVPAHIPALISKAFPAAYHIELPFRLLIEDAFEFLARADRLRMRVLVKSHTILDDGIAPCDFNIRQPVIDFTYVVGLLKHVLLHG